MMAFDWILNDLTSATKNPCSMDTEWICLMSSNLFLVIDLQYHSVGVGWI